MCIIMYASASSGTGIRILLVFQFKKMAGDHGLQRLIILLCHNYYSNHDSAPCYTAIMVTNINFVYSGLLIDGHVY